LKPAPPPQDNSTADKNTAPQAESSNGQAPPASKTNIDTGDMSVAPVGANIIENHVEVPAQKIDDISDITIAETGADVIENPVEVPAQKIDDISGITLAEAGADMIENPEPKEKAKIPDTSELSLDD